MKNVSRMILLVVLMVGLGGVISPRQVAAGCYSCDSVVGCIDACQGTNGKGACTHTKTCTSSCVVTSCYTQGGICAGSRNCGGSCHSSIQECNVDNVGASLIVPNGEVAPDGSWLERKDRELELCRSSAERPAEKPANTMPPVTSFTTAMTSG